MASFRKARCDPVFWTPTRAHMRASHSSHYPSGFVSRGPDVPFKDWRKESRWGRKWFRNIRHQIYSQLISHFLSKPHVDILYKSCQFRVCRSWHSWDFKLWLQQSWKIAFAFRPWISWAMRRWPWISYLLAVFSMKFFSGSLQGCSSNERPSKESTCFLTIGGVGLAYKKDCSSSKLVETDLPYPVRWKILQDENLGDFGLDVPRFVFFPSRRALHFFFLLDDGLEKKRACLYSVP